MLPAALTLPVGLTLAVLLGHAADGPVAAFSFDEPSGRVALDASAFGNKARIWHAQRVPGPQGLALSFADPQAAVRIPRRPQVNLGAALTLEAWIYPTVADDTSRIIIAKNDEYLLRMDKRTEGGRISFFVHVGSPAVTWEPRVSSREPPALNAWHHIVATWDGAMLRLFLDGELQQERERTGQPNPNPYPVMVGNFEYPSCHGAHFGGLIDEVRIYSRALPAEEVRERYGEIRRGP